MELTCQFMLTASLVHLVGLLGVQAQSNTVYCGVIIRNGWINHTNRCNLSCPMDVKYQIVYYMECWETYPDFFKCSGLCQDQTKRFESICYPHIHKWTPPLNDTCRPAVTTTAAGPRTPAPPADTDDEENPSRSIIWTTVVALVLAMIMLTVCAMAVKASRNRRAQQSRRSNQHNGSPMMIYSVALGCGPGQALSDSINSYMRQNSVTEHPGYSLDVGKPPSYDEVIIADRRGGVTADSPPPYTEVAETSRKDSMTT